MEKFFTTTKTTQKQKLIFFDNVIDPYEVIFNKVKYLSQGARLRNI